MPVRIWGRLTKTPLTEWCDKRAAHWDAAARGSSALQAALLTMVCLLYTSDAADDTPCVDL
eukprot:5263255-Pyramimonas_sp.AAC.1